MRVIYFFYPYAMERNDKVVALEQQLTRQLETKYQSKFHIEKHRYHVCGMFKSLLSGQHDYRDLSEVSPSRSEPTMLAFLILKNRSWPTALFLLPAKPTAIIFIFSPQLL